MFAFTYKPCSVKAAYKIQVPFLVRLPKELSKEPITLGDHLHRRRLELGLYQKDVATRLDVTTSTNINWERALKIKLRYLPGVISFIGYNLISMPDDPMERLSWYKQINGLTFDQLGERMNRDSEQLADWLSGHCYPCQRNREAIDRVLQDNLPIQ